jgi:glycosyltransferase involved in cell wall biosynthesis
MLQQTCADFELIIIDDASTDNTISIIREYRDERIQLVEKPLNSGYPASLNIGLQLARGEYIARMDGDDIADPERFALQLKAFQNDSELVLCGSRIEIIGSNETWDYPLMHEDINVALLSYCCIAHPSVMIKKSFFIENAYKYDSLKEPAEDYDLWVRMIRKGKFINLPQRLLKYRVHEQQVSKKKQDDQYRNSIVVKAYHLSALTDMVTAEKFYSVNHIVEKKNVPGEIAFLKWLIETSNELKKKNIRMDCFEQVQFNVFVESQIKTVLRKIFLSAKKYNYTKLPELFVYSIKYPNNFSIMDIIKSMGKCMICHSVK